MYQILVPLPMIVLVVDTTRRSMVAVCAMWCSIPYNIGVF